MDHIRTLQYTISIFCRNFDIWPYYCTEKGNTNCIRNRWLSLIRCDPYLFLLYYGWSLWNTLRLRSILYLRYILQLRPFRIFVRKISCNSFTCKLWKRAVLRRNQLRFLWRQFVIQWIHDLSLYFPNTRLSFPVL